VLGGVDVPPGLNTSGHRYSLIMATMKYHFPQFTLSGIWLPHLREIGLVVGTYFAYMYSRTLVFSDFQGTALANAQRVIDFEKNLGFFWEPVWQSWTIESARSLVIFFNWAYIVTFFPIVLTASIVLYFTNRERYKYYRNVVLLSFLIALVGFSVKQIVATLPAIMILYYLCSCPDHSPALQFLKKWRWAITGIIAGVAGFLFYKLLTDETFLIGPSRP
jgi:hypothetical protein